MEGHRCLRKGHHSLMRGKGKSVTWFLRPVSQAGRGVGGGGGESANRGGGDGLAVTANLAARTHSQPEGHSAG